VFYNFYVNTIKQIPVAREFLPINKDDIKNYLENIAGEDFAAVESKRDETLF